MSSNNQKPTIPSADYRWGLYKLSTGQSWVGLSERETRLIFEIAAQNQPENWLIWNITWAEWKPLQQFDQKWATRLSEFPSDWPKPKIKEQK